MRSAFLAVGDRAHGVYTPNQGFEERTTGQEYPSISSSIGLGWLLFSFQESDLSLDISLVRLLLRRRVYTSFTARYLDRGSRWCILCFAW
jgi:hypothetical protein